MNSVKKEQLVSLAQQILLNNRKDGFTIPTQRLYPFQWNWDSGFTSLGWSHFRLDYAMQEMRTLFSGQWANGMIPHILFHSENETTYFPNHPFWESHRNPGASTSPKTSGITQPPVHGFVLERVFEQHQDKAEVRAFVEELFPKVVKLHQFFYQYRDPQQEGLVFIYHPWESGRDNSPLWDESLKGFSFDPEEIPPYQRKDQDHADASERPTDLDYDRYVYLVELGKKYAYDGDEIAEESPFLVQDTLINAVLIRSTEGLIRIGKVIGEETTQLESWHQRSMARFEEKLWHEGLGTYVGYDLRNERQLPHKEVGGLTALFAGIPSVERADRIQTDLQDLSDRGFFLCPSFDPDSVYFDSRRYWKGPIWAPINWLVYHGLRRYELGEMAEVVKRDFLGLVERQGFYEYFEAQQAVAERLAQGYGGGQFSWTAAVVLDLLRE